MCSTLEHHSTGASWQMHLAGRGGRMQLASYEVEPAVVVASYLE